MNCHSSLEFIWIEVNLEESKEFTEIQLNSINKNDVNLEI